MAQSFQKKGYNKFLKISVWVTFKLNFIGVRTGNTMCYVLCDAG